MMIAHDVEMIWAASFWKLDNWANGIVLRCVAAAGGHGRPQRMGQPSIDLAKVQAKSAGAARIIFEVYDEGTAAALPEGASVLRQSYVTGI